MQSETAYSLYSPDEAVVMRHNQRMGYEELRAEAIAALEKSNKSQADLARELGVTRAAISRALKEEESTLASVLMKIIEHLTPYQVEEEKTYTAKRKDD